VTEHVEDHGGFRTRYLTAGDPSHPAMVLVHDGAWGGSSTSTWENIIPLLSESFYIIAPDLQGFGGSQKVVFLDLPPYAPRIENLRALLSNVLGDRRYHLVGNSFGGSLAMRMLADGKDSGIASVVSIGGTGGPWRTAEALQALSEWDGTREDLKRVTRILIDENSSLFEAQIDTRLRWASEPGHYRAVKALGIVLPEPLASGRVEDPWPEQLRGNTAPMLLIAGQHDTLVESDWLSHFEGLMPHLETVTIDTFHEPNIDHPELIADLITTFANAHSVE
jgi:pimeloyl-ACP methyl ester carboxylesterase